MKNVFIEGIQGMGKSTLLNRINTAVPEFHVCREGDHSPIELAWCAWMTQDLKAIIFSRYSNFSETGYLFECSFFQNIMEDLILFHQLSDGEIVEFYYELYAKIKKEQFLLLYLYSDEVEEAIKTIKEERSDSSGNELWYSLMLEYLVHSPYGEKNGYRTFEDMIVHFRHRQQLELRIIRDIIGEKAVVLPAKKWKMEEIIAVI